MFNPVDTRVPSEVEEEVQAIYRRMYPQGDRRLVSKAFSWAEQCFSGRYEPYQAIDARYHDFEHTLQGTLCLARLLEGRHRAEARPPLPPRLFELSLLAILFHDAGYLKTKDDLEGTGAKYTIIHVGRSAEFARNFLARMGYAESELLAVQNMIRCTGVRASLDSIPFQNDLERMAGYALASADLLGQMAAPDYVDKLPVLFLEFAEAVDYSGEQESLLAYYRSAEDLMRHTPEFFHSYVMPRIQNDFQGLYRYLNQPYPDGPNSYLERIQANLAKLRRKFPDA